jgi:peptidoglycan hydrolase CwlO-like protein
MTAENADIQQKIPEMEKSIETLEKEIEKEKKKNRCFQCFSLIDIEKTVNI